MAANEDIFASSGPLTLCLSAFAMVVQFLVISVSVDNDSYYANPVSTCKFHSGIEVLGAFKLDHL